ncbi:RebB family R body protein [Vibrio bivalvicida]|uniref:Glycerol-3-phosphate dehydrogenase subunit C n=1 Tax=Vibrio bivalvicida TaxID=1276888 RepID=A0A177XX66_9VIBR|nr:RebB family R body protein [Vibrio bivalvicida]OAJ93207.1 hypothetical protein APB76_14675 [Vibrio bivalvicida]
MPDPVSQSVAEATLLTVGMSSANAGANLINAANTALCLSFMNAVGNQQAGNMTRQTSTVQANAGVMSTGNAVQSAVVGHIL